MSVVSLLLNYVEKIRLPVHIKSTSVIIYHRLKKQMILEDTLMSYLCLFMACKFEDIHGCIEKIMKYAGCLDVKTLYDHEIKAFEILQFNFSIPNLFYKVFAMKSLLEGQNVTFEKDWEMICKKIDFILRLEISKFQINNIAFACLEIDSKYANYLDLSLNTTEIEEIKILSLNELQQ